MTAALLIFAIENADTVPFLSSHSTAYFLATCSELSMPLYLSETFVVCIRARETPRRVVYPACLVRRDIVLILTGYWTVADFAFATEGLPDARKQSTVFVFDTLPEPLDLHYRRTVHENDGFETRVNNPDEGRALALHSCIDHLQSASLPSARFSIRFIVIMELQHWAMRVWRGLELYAPVTHDIDLQVFYCGRRLSRKYYPTMFVCCIHRDYWHWNAEEHLGYVSYPAQRDSMNIPQHFEELTLPDL